ncbi:MAG: cobalamin-dependent protein, partial [Methanoregulaceae archaeon]|nr:cobalamin-dependent protein [Methanoregulaceae archaeon]
MGEAIAFVYPYIRDRKPIEREKLFPPLGIASLKSQVLAQGLNSRIHDGTFSRIDEIVKNVERQQPAIVGIYAMLTMSRNALDIAREIRNRLPGTLLVAGGPLPTLYPERFLSDFDLVLRG